MNEKIINKLYPRIKARMGGLPPQFPPEVKRALASAEMMWRAQGGIPPVISIVTTTDDWEKEGGVLLGMMPDWLRGPDMMEHMVHVLKAKEDAKAVYFAYVGGPEPGPDILCVIYLTHSALHNMKAECNPTGGTRSLGPWSIETVYNREAN